MSAHWGSLRLFVQRAGTATWAQLQHRLPMGSSVTAQDGEQTDAEERLIAAVKGLGVFSRIDEDGRVLVYDGQKEYEVTVDPTGLLTKRTGSHLRRIDVGTSSLTRLERGDVTELFPNGAVSAVDEEHGSATMVTPVSPHYAPLEWDGDAVDPDEDDGIVAQGADWRYAIHPVCGTDGVVIGYRVWGGDYESGEEFGSSLIGGEPGELTIVNAKAAASADYRSRYLEAEHFLDNLLDDWNDDDGPRTRRNDQGRIVCRVDEPGITEVEVVATLRDYDGYDASGRIVAVSLKTILSFTYNGDRNSLLDELRRLIRLDARSGDS